MKIKFPYFPTEKVLYILIFLSVLLSFFAAEIDGDPKPTLSFSSVMDVVQFIIAATSFFFAGLFVIYVVVILLIKFLISKVELKK